MDPSTPITEPGNPAHRFVISRIKYRVSQFWAALTAAPEVEDWMQARQVLSPSLMVLFQGMQRSEQAHSMRVMRKLIAANRTQADLLAAGLLHDVGKSRVRLWVWERVWIVLGRALFPGKVKIWGQGQPVGWKRAFVVAEQHAAWGAEMAAQAGASPLTTSLIRRHQESVRQMARLEDTPDLEQQLLDYLQQFDDES